jgi:hypothetical protein
MVFIFPAKARGNAFVQFVGLVGWGLFWKQCSTWFLGVLRFVVFLILK